jgi:hypothetical protein
MWRLPRLVERSVVTLNVDLDAEITFVIDSVCREDNSRRRRSFAQLCFKYHDVYWPGEFEYTPCLEVLNSMCTCGHVYTHVPFITLIYSL